MSIHGSQWGSGDSTCQHPCGVKAPRVLRRCRDSQGVRPWSSVSQDWTQGQARTGWDRSWLSVAQHCVM